MSKAMEKAEREKRVFAHFLTKAGNHLLVANYESREPPEPDILCTYQNGTKVAFELCEISDEDLTELCNRRDTKNGQFIRTIDPSEQVARKKLKTGYVTKFPVELIFYWGGRTVSTDNMVIPKLASLFRNASHGYQKVWYLGEFTLGVISDDL